MYMHIPKGEGKGISPGRDKKGREKEKKWE
jgi:hypothetical protein